MFTAKNNAELQNILDGWDGASTAFVPTMGALHEGHISLVKLAKEKADKVIVSIYVNPTQFAPHEDFDQYPRDVEGDLKKLERAGVDLVFLPSQEDIYPNGPQITHKGGQAAEGLETDFRPHFFDGVVTVVHRLFTLVQPDLAVFGEKDFQQLQVIKEMAVAEGMDIEIMGGPIVRDEAGLALSSRNAYLNPEELEIAQTLNRALHQFQSSLRAQRSNPETDAGLPRRSDDLLAMTEKKLLENGFNKVDYVAQRWGRVLAAVWLGKTRLIDNMEI